MEIGTRLGPYEIVAPLGAGGMGEVYRARDTKLGREVAIKVLPEAVSQDPEKLARFGREAHLLASVNHPNIATLHGLEESNGQQFLVMELVEGETLAERLVRGPMPAEEALPLFQHLAEGLETAHEKGIIHRDLKPSNIKITPEGVPKILDFGLAKALVEEGALQDNSQSPTLTRDATGTGVLLGTAAYMSPEQARGKPVDKRTDIFSFGIVLYEVLTGKRAFPGDDVSDVLASIIKLEPDWKALPSELDPRLQNLLRRCLAKDRKNRLQAIGDVRLEIQEILAGPLSVSTAGGMREKIAWGLVVLLASMVGVFAFTRVPPTLEPRFTRRASLALVDSNGSPLSPRALSLDNSGHTLVFSALGSEGTSLFLRRLDETETVSIPGTQGVVGVPAVSPDGTWVAFVLGQELKKVALGGGAPVSLHEMPKRPFGIAWVGNESLIFGGTEGLFLLPADGGSPERITTVDTEGGELDHRWPYVTADGATLAYTVWSGSDDGRVRLRSLRTGIERTLTQGSSPRLTPTGRLVLWRPASLWAAPIDLGALELSGEVVPVLDRVAGYVDGYAPFDLDEEGTFVYQRLADYASPLKRVDRHGVALRQISGSFRGSLHAPPRFSPDGGSVAVTRHLQGGIDQVIIHDVRRGTATPLAGPGDSRNPVWSPDGTHLTFSSTREGSRDIFEVALAGNADVQPLLIRPGDQVPTSWSPNGQVLAFYQGPIGRRDIWLLPRDGEPYPLLDDPTADELYAAFSPAGRVLAYLSDESGRPEVYVQTYPTPGRRIRISTGGAHEAMAPVWAPRGDGLYYLGPEGDIFYVPITIEPELGAGELELVLQGAVSANEAGFDIAPDGQSFVLMGSTYSVEMIVNWFEELKRLVPTE